MPWKEESVMSQRTRFVVLAKQGTKTITQLCQEFGISRKSGYKWIQRARDEGIVNGVKEKSRRPKNIARKTAVKTEERIVQLRQKYPYWGARKLIKIYNKKHRERAPSERTVNRIIERNGLLREENRLDVATKRFERDAPNDLWQIDYKGEFNLRDCPRKCYPLTILDDHSRYNLCLDAHDRISWVKTKESLAKSFCHYGMPLELLMDRGSAWYSSHGKYTHWTRLTVWLMLLGIKIIYSGIRHPQTQGKIERYHKTLKYDLIRRNSFRTFSETQERFNAFRYEYNNIRPHESLEMKTPASRYVASERKYTGKVPDVDYPEGALVKKLNQCGVIHYKGVQWFISEALPGQNVMLVEKDPEVEVYFVNTLVKILNLKEKIAY